jgi:hypothetical protein
MLSFHLSLTLIAIVFMIAFVLVVPFRRNTFSLDKRPTELALAVNVLTFLGVGYLAFCFAEFEFYALGIGPFVETADRAFEASLYQDVAGALVRFILEGWFLAMDAVSGSLTLVEALTPIDEASAALVSTFVGEGAAPALLQDVPPTVLSGGTFALMMLGVHAVTRLMGKRELGGSGLDVVRRASFWLAVGTGLAVAWPLALVALVIYWRWEVAIVALGAAGAVLVLAPLVVVVALVGGIAFQILFAMFIFYALVNFGDVSGLFRRGRA